MSSFGALKIITVVLLSSIVSVGSTVAIVRYAPEFVAMPLPEPDIQLKMLVAPSSLICESHTEWEDVPELSTSLSLRRDSTVLIMFSYRYSYNYDANNPDARGFVYLNASVDGDQLETYEVCASYIEESSRLGNTILFSASGLKPGAHNLSFSWRNRGATAGILQNTVIEIVVIPTRNVL